MLNLALNQNSKLQLEQPFTLNFCGQSFSQAAEEKPRDFLQISYCREMRKGKQLKIWHNVKNQRLAKDLAEFKQSFHSYSTFEAYVELSPGQQWQDKDVLELKIVQIQLDHQKTDNYLFEIQIDRDFPYSAPEIYLRG